MGRAPFAPTGNVQSATEAPGKPAVRRRMLCSPAKGIFPGAKNPDSILLMSPSKTTSQERAALDEWSALGIEERAQDITDSRPASTKPQHPSRRPGFDAEREKALSPSKKAGSVDPLKKAGSVDAGMVGKDAAFESTPQRRSSRRQEAVQQHQEALHQPQGEPPLEPEFEENTSCSTLHADEISADLQQAKRDVAAFHSSFFLGLVLAAAFFLCLRMGLLNL